MTAAERRIYAHLSAAAPRMVDAFEIRDCAQLASEGSVRVLVHRLRHRHGVAIESRNGPYGGYRLAREVIADEVERLIGVLDAIDGDPDFEPEEDRGPDDVGERGGDTFLTPRASFAPVFARGGFK